MPRSSRLMSTWQFVLSQRGEKCSKLFNQVSKWLKAELLGAFAGSGELRPETINAPGPSTSFNTQF